MRRPTLKSMLVCDQIIEDVVTRKKTLVGLFERIAAPEFPTIHGSMGVFFQISDAEGPYEFAVELASIESNETLGVAKLPPAKIPSAAHTSNFALMFSGIKFERPGMHEFRLWCNGQVLGQHVLQVVQFTPPAHPQPPT